MPFVSSLKISLHTHTRLGSTSTAVEYVYFNSLGKYFFNITAYIFSHGLARSVIEYVCFNTEGKYLLLLLSFAFTHALWGVLRADRDDIPLVNINTE